MCVYIYIVYMYTVIYTSISKRRKISGIFSSCLTQNRKLKNFWVCHSVYDFRQVRQDISLFQDSDHALSQLRILEWVIYNALYVCVCAAL